VLHLFSTFHRLQQIQVQVESIDLSVFGQLFQCCDKFIEKLVFFLEVFFLLFLSFNFNDSFETTNNFLG